MGVFGRIFAELAKGGGETDEMMIDATHLKAHRTAASLLKKRIIRGLSAARQGIAEQCPERGANKRWPEPLTGR